MTPDMLSIQMARLAQTLISRATVPADKQALEHTLQVHQWLEAIAAGRLQVLPPADVNPAPTDA